MKVKIIIFFQIFVLCSCLKTTSIDKFKQKYDWEISEGEFLYVTSNTHMYYYEFHYQDKTYEASANSNAGDWYSRHKYNYQIIFDKKNPGKNHIVLFQYPIIKEPKIFLKVQEKLFGYEQLNIKYVSNMNLPSFLRPGMMFGNLNLLNFYLLSITNLYRR